MRPWIAILTAAVVVGAVAPAGSAAEEADMEALLRSMNERVERLEGELGDTKQELATTQERLGAAEDELGASREQVARQQQVMDRAGIEGSGSSGLSSFFQTVEIGGWIAASWLWNFNNPDDAALEDAATTGVNQGVNGVFYPFHPDHNSFAVDQLWFEVEKPVSEESPGGFRADLAWGKTAGLLRTPVNRTGYDVDGDTVGGLDSANDFVLYQAYVQYLTPFGVTVRAGKFGTLLGAEVAQAPYNFNITRGNVYNLLQPFYHYGVILDGDAGPLSYSIGAVNSGACCGTEPDFNNAKSLLAGVSYGGETFSIGTSIEWGPEAVGNSSGEQGTVDVLLNWDPTESFSSYVNFDYLWVGNQEGWGLSVAGRYGVTEKLGLALRGEWLKDRNDLFGFGGDDAVIYGVTGTVDYTLTDGLIARAEVRWDTVSVGGAPNDVFINSSSTPAFDKSNQVVGGLEVIYQF